MIFSDQRESPRALEVATSHEQMFDFIEISICDGMLYLSYITVDKGGGKVQKTYVIGDTVRRRCFSMDDRTYMALRSAAQARGISMSCLLRELILTRVLNSAKIEPR